MSVLSKLSSKIFPQACEEIVVSSVDRSILRTGRVPGWLGGQTFGYYSEIIESEGRWFLQTKVSEIVPPFLLAVFLAAFLACAFAGTLFSLFVVVLLVIVLAAPTIACRFAHEGYAVALGLRSQ